MCLCTAVFFFNDTATTEIYTLSLHDALPICNPVFITLSDGSIRNAYEVRIQNRNAEPNIFRLSALSDPYLRLSVQGEEAAAIQIPADQTMKLLVFLTSPADAEIFGRVPARLWVENLMTRERSYYDTHFQGPDQ